MPSILAGAIVGFAFWTCDLPSPLKSKAHSWRSEYLCSAQKKYSHLHWKPSSPIFRLHVQQRDVFACTFFGGSESSPPASAGSAGRTAPAMAAGAGDDDDELALAATAAGEASAGFAAGDGAAAGAAGAGVGTAGAAGVGAGAGAAGTAVAAVVGAAAAAERARLSFQHFEHMPPVLGLPKKPQPLAQSDGADSCTSFGCCALPSALAIFPACVCFLRAHSEDLPRQ
jgi:hypothetical protein